jgi:uncharacterized membrane protein YsdA (DUF1294 family)
MRDPIYRFGLLSFGGAALGALALVAARLLELPTAWLVAINLAALVTYRYDKAVAGSARTRVPEAVLLLLEAAGGTVGAAAAIWLIRPRHKSRSGQFLVWFFAIFVLQALAIAAFLWG